MQQAPDLQKFKVHRYWVRNNEPPLGYVMHQRYPLIGLGGTTLLALVALVLITHGVQTIGLVVCCSMILFSAMLLSLSLRYSGWYEVDMEGNPHAFISRTPPPGVTPANGLSRKQFLHSVRSRQHE